MTEPYKALGISDAVLTFGEKVLAGLTERFAQIDAISEANQMKVIAAMQKNRLAANHFNLSSGYGYDDEAGVVTRHGSVHLGMATQTDAGLMVPVIHGADGLGGLSLPAPRQTIQAQHGVERIAAELRRAGESAQQLTVCTLGPMTNLALAMRLEPAIIERIAQIVLMGGSSTGGNITPSAEYNVWADPHAAQIVFSSACPIVVLGLEATLQVRSDRDWFHVDIALRAERDGALFAERTWSERFPR